MKRTLIAVLAAAALPVPAMTQQSNPNASPSQHRHHGAMHHQSRASNQQQGRSIRMTRAQVRMLQQDLDRRGLNAGPADGIFGSKTQAALIEFQRQNGLNATGQMSGRTLAALMANRNSQRASNRNRGNGQPQNPGPNQNAGPNQNRHQQQPGGPQ